MRPVLNPSAVKMTTAAKRRAHPFAVKFVSSGGCKKLPDASFEGKPGQCHVNYSKRVVSVGCGNGSVSDLQKATCAAVTAARAQKIDALEFKLPAGTRTNVHPEVSAGSLLLDAGKSPRPFVAQTIACSAVMGAYEYGRMKSSSPTARMPPALSVSTSNVNAARHIRDGAIIGNAVNDARSLGNLRPDEGTPQFYERWMHKHIASIPNVRVRHVIRGRALKDQGLRLMHAVGRSAVHEPVLVVYEYRGNKASDAATALVGKGLTFDCGGMNIKPYGAMESMHQDMMGAAAVIGTLRAVAQLQLPVNVVAVAAFAENAIGPNAYLPSTIIKSLNGKTVEVLNTDAEGRLVLADALTFLQRKANLSVAPTSIVDIATLTGAIVIGLGNERAGIFSNHAHLLHDLMVSGARTHELLWPMPIGEEHTKAMKGGIADLTNAAEGRAAGSCTAAAFLQEFIEKGTLWAHLDIAGPGMGKDKATPQKPAGAPGFGVRLLVDYLQHRPLK